MRRHTLLATLLVGLLVSSCGGGDPPIPVLAPVPDFRLVNQAGEPFGLAELRGEVWIASFMFTTCPTVCPMLTTKMGNLQRRLADRDGVRFVSFTVDPERDTPEVLTRYAERHGADQRTWTFLTGDPDAVRRAVVDGMRVAMGERQADGDILHGTHFVLVDAEGRIRGYYRSEQEGMDALARDVDRLLSR
ncbi:MAG: SCO family protein [Myxococcales bacterium]|nr:SCO family protein [Myxococcales bacterium]